MFVRLAFTQLLNVSESSSLVAAITTRQSLTVVVAPVIDTAALPFDPLVMLIGLLVSTPRNAAIKPETWLPRLFVVGAPCVPL
jgi:hypothetical protein